ncbi:uncharacterized protein LOC114527825 [Dendronephthya gigantea]|uniref:uncharacterized protein LOC114527825 n=1 Tax=Dendronephthya gigantea TaxID=151771 RepID=UPI00106A82A7|nr:uncharacterized protein LOC114527825 [Dendronephthya gigantea]
MARSIFCLIIMLFCSSLKTTSARGSVLNDTCFEDCVKLLRETAEVRDDKLCPKKIETFYEEKKTCLLNCNNISSIVTNDTDYSRDTDFVQAPSSPLLYLSDYNSITLKWNTSRKVINEVAFYILQIHPDFESLKDPLELPPSIPRYAMVKVTRHTNSQRFTVENLVNGFNYKFRVAEVGLNGTSSEYSEWSSWYSTSRECNRTSKIVDGLYGSYEVILPCSLSRITLNVAIKAVGKNPVVLDAMLNWKNPPGFTEFGQIVKVTVELLQHEDKTIDAMCAHYHDSDFKKNVFPMENTTSLLLPSESESARLGDWRKPTLHFGCSYIVKFKTEHFKSPNSFETTTTFRIPECLQGVRSCPVANTRGINSGAVAEKSFSNGNGNSSYAANISWNAEGWLKTHKIEYFHVTVEKWPRNSRGYHHDVDVQAKDGVVFYHTTSYNMSEGNYKAVVKAYHGMNCIHDIIETRIFQIQKPCSQGCTENATCMPRGVLDGSAKCTCIEGYTGNGTVCTAMTSLESMASQGKKEEVNVTAIVVPVAFVLALIASIFALIFWNIRRKNKLLLNVIEAHAASAISPSPSNTNLYQHCPPRFNFGEISSKENEVEMDEKEVNVIYVPQEIQDAINHGLTDGYEFNAEQIKFEECLGKGAFGYVHRARALGITAEPEWTLVAVKTLSEPVTEKSIEDFIAEIELMKKLGEHENTIQMLGCCTLTLPIGLIMEYAPHGNLLTYLRTVKTKNSGIEQESCCDEKLPLGENMVAEKESDKINTESALEMDICLESFALQIANGMTYVAGRGIVHRDLAARNILIGRDHKLKISDFGLSKEGVYVKSTSGKIPLRWLSIEAIRERLYSSASDVWSYGIVLWEICTLGDFPYPSLSDRELLKYLVGGERMEKPSNCTDEMYSIMLECWQADPEDRPTFSYLRDTLWKMNKGETPYVNVDPIAADQGDNIESKKAIVT